MKKLKDEIMCFSAPRKTGIANVLGKILGVVFLVLVSGALGILCGRFLELMLNSSQSVAMALLVGAVIIAVAILCKKSSD